MDRVALIGENSVEYVEKLINIWNEGNCAVLLDWRITCQTLVEMMLRREFDCVIFKKSIMKRSLN